MTLLLVIQSHLAFAQGTEPLRFLFLNPTRPFDPFWDKTQRMMEKAARDLSVELKVIYADRNPFQAQELVASAFEEAKRLGKPYHGMLFHNQKHNARNLLQLSEKYKVPTFLFNAALEEYVPMGPRSSNPYWVGQMTPDDESIGKKMFLSLWEHFIQENPGEYTSNMAPQVSLLAISGPLADQAALKRLKGLKEVLTQYPQVKLVQVVSADWSEKKAYLKADKLLQRYPEVRLIWVASDDMALGVLKALKKHKKQAGKDLFLSGVDVTPRGMNAVEHLQMVSSFGGHFLEGAWSLILLHDYVRGVDFISEKLIWKSQMVSFDSGTLPVLKPLLDPQTWDGVSLKIFSKTVNPNMTHYPFELSPDQIWHTLLSWTALRE